MRIAIDTRTLNSPKTGDRTVTLGLVKGLIGLAEAEGLELVLVGQEYLDNIRLFHCFRDGHNFHAVFCCRIPALALAQTDDHIKP